MDRFRESGQPRQPPRPADDEAAVDRARHRLQRSGTATVPTDELIAGELAPGECVITVRRGVVVERRSPGAGPGRGLPGDLYVTNRRVIVLGAIGFDYPLGAISEAVVAGRLLLLRVDDARGLTIQVDDPVMLRLEIAAARAVRSVPAGA